jgi:outer membrane protein assembly factor BamA
VFGVGAFATENGTKGGAAGGQWTFRDDRYRYRGGVGDFTISLDFYGIGDRLPIPVDKVGYTLKGLGSFQQGMMRLGDSHTFIGARWIYLDLDTRLDVPPGDAGLSANQVVRRSSGLGVAIEHDSRDNIFTPNRGVIAAADGTFYDPAIGSSNRFETYRAHVFDYIPLASKWTLGLRADARFARGDVPFYMLPYIDLRGIPAARFQDSSVAVLETELRYDIDERWSLVGFIGAGKAWGRDTFPDAETPVSGGTGFRYLIARRLGLYVGIDYAKSTVGDAIYIQVGGAWR